MKMEFKFGTVTVPDGQKGDWRVSTFTVLPEKDNLGLFMSNFRAIRDGNAFAVVHPGTYKRLTHKTRGVIMSNTPMEVRTNIDAYFAAKGRVLINGLGLGMLLEGILHKPDVTYVRVIEAEQDVIDLVGPHFANDPRVEIVKADAYTYKPAKGEKFDYVWHDIWDEISADNLPKMATLNRKYARAAEAQGTWSREQVRRMERRENRRYW
jgi:hypothetical protein